MAQINQYINFSSGESLPFTFTKDETCVDVDTNIDNIIEQLNNNLTSPRFKILVLYPDETINYEIPLDDIQIGGSYSENYQNGQRRSLSFTLYNESGKYTPDINTLWTGTRLRLEMGLNLIDNTTIWFSKGIYVINKLTPNYTSSGKTLQISASDKFSLFEDSTGKLDVTYEIEAGSNIEEVIKTILLTDMGNGFPLDSRPIIYHSSLKNKTTQCVISKSPGDSYGSILLDLATQLSAEIFYNAQGYLTILPINDVTNDSDKTLIYNFNTSKGDISQLDFNFDMNTIVNKIIVIGSSANGGVYRSEALNDDISSPLCYQRIGYRLGNVINDSNITSNVLAEERAKYELRQQLVIKSSTTASVLFNPLLEVNNLITITDEFFNLNYERFLIQSVSCSLDFSGTTSITFSNLRNLPFVVK